MNIESDGLSGSVGVGQAHIGFPVDLQFFQHNGGGVGTVHTFHKVRVCSW